LFLGCDNHLLAMLDATSGKVLATVPLGEGVDGCAFDPATKLVFGSCGDGTTTIAREDGDKLTPVQLLKTEKSARTMAIDPATHKIYLPSAKFETPAPGQRRGKIIPGTFKILVYGTDK
jgi:DNA-binding beta-propeller fold protein YncE